VKTAELKFDEQCQNFTTIAQLARCDALKVLKRIIDEIMLMEATEIPEIHLIEKRQLLIRRAALLGGVMFRPAIKKVFKHFFRDSSEMTAFVNKVRHLQCLPAYKQMKTN